MAKPSTADQWLAFYEAAAQFRDAKPWQHVYDSMIFGVQNPSSGEIGWCCIMGNAGEYFALAVYKGAGGLDSYFQLADSEFPESAFNPETLNGVLSQDCWMISFENAGKVSKEQKAHLKKLGLTFKGAHQWIVVETMDPGFSPWLPELADLPFLIQCLREALGIAERAAGNPEFLFDPDTFLVRTPVKTPDGLRWEDRFIDADELPVPEPAQPVQPSKEFLEKVKFMPVLDGAFVIASFLSPANVQERKDWRPWRPMLLLAIDPGSGYILSNDMAPLPEVPSQLERFLLKTFKAYEGKPRQIGVHNLVMGEWLADICDQTDIELVLLSGEEDFFTDVLESMSGITG